jgi:hypothetical protein
MLFGIVVGFAAALTTLFKQPPDDFSAPALVGEDGACAAEIRQGFLYTCLVLAVRGQRSNTGSSAAGPAAVLSRPVLVPPLK